jgi:hypothetical protein
MLANDAGDTRTIQDYLGNRPIQSTARYTGARGGPLWRFAYSPHACPVSGARSTAFAKTQASAGIDAGLESKIGPLRRAVAPTSGAIVVTSWSLAQITDTAMPGKPLG